MQFEPRDPGYETRVRDSFARQGVMDLLSVEIVSVEPGQCTLELPNSPKLSQQQGALHGGVISTVLDSACGYAALSLMAADREVMTVELKTSFLAAGFGDRFRFVGRVIKPGRRLTFTEGAAYVAVAQSGEDQWKSIATMTATMICVNEHR